VVAGGAAFVDCRLVRFCLGLPQSLRSIPGRRKPVLEAAAHSLLPEAIRTRRDKRGFDDVYWRGLAVNLPHLEQMVQASPLADMGVLDRPKLLEALRQAAVGIGDIIACDRLSKALALIAWADQALRPHGPTRAVERMCWGGFAEANGSHAKTQRRQEGKEKMREEN
jgi:asparagine synthase (glutamine-hydrolysing)